DAHPQARAGYRRSQRQDRGCVDEARPRRRRGRADQAGLRARLDMSVGLMGKKCGRRRGFTEEGCSVPVTVIEATPNRVTQVKTTDSAGYVAVQVTAGAKRASLLTQPAKGHSAQAKVEP